MVSKGSKTIIIVQKYHGSLYMHSIKLFKPRFTSTNFLFFNQQKLGFKEVSQPLP